MSELGDTLVERPSRPSDDADIDLAGRTDVGQVRENNQDQFFIARLNKSLAIHQTSLPLARRVYGQCRGTILMVADGMGGHAGGEKASDLAIRHLVGGILDTIHWHFNGNDEEERFVESLRSILRDAHVKIQMESDRDASIAGMGTTLTMAYLVGSVMYVVHAGDSRCYLVRGGQAKCLTTDHTMARKMVEEGGLRPEDEADSRWSNVLWNVLGGRGDSQLIAEVHRVELEPKDTVVLCSDGLHRYQQETDIAAAATESSSAEDLCDALVDAANRGGGADNITAAVLRMADSHLLDTTWVEDLAEEI